MKSADIDITISRNVVNEALLKSLHALTRSEDRWNSSRNRGVTSQQGIEVPVYHKGISVEALGVMGNVRSSSKVLLRRRCRVRGTVKDSNSRSGITRGHATTKEWGSRSGLVGRVRGAAILKCRDLLVGDLRALGHNTSTAGGVGDIGELKISRETTLSKVRCGKGRIVGRLRSLPVCVGRNAGGSIAGRVQELAVSRCDIGAHDRGNCAVRTNRSSIDSKTAKLVDNSIHARVNRTVARETGQVTSGIMSIGNLGSQIMLRNTTSVGSSYGALSRARGIASLGSKVIIGRHVAIRMIRHSCL